MYPSNQILFYYIPTFFLKTQMLFIFFLHPIFSFVYKQPIFPMMTCLFLQPWIMKFGHNAKLAWFKS